MTIVARRINANPVRTGAEVWQFIAGLLSTPDSAARIELEKINGIAACVVAEEYPKERPMILINEGPRLRIYCVYGTEAIEGESADESSLSWNPTDASWKMFLPVGAGDLGWMKEELVKLSPKIFLYGPEEELEGGLKDNSRPNQKFSVNEETFKNL